MIGHCRVTVVIIQVVFDGISWFVLLHTMYLLQESGVKDILKDVFLPWYNAYRFLVQNILR